MLDIQYFYDKEGIRRRKIVNGVETNYFTENSNIIFEVTNGNVLYYMRTDEHDLIGFKYNNETYYYKKNYQGDILGIYNSNYELVCTYEYDSYGSIVSIKDALGQAIEDANHIANINPYRYRSYYYDKETKLYYLNSRYYNPLWGRFINADGIIGTSESYLGYNLYAYCENNPIINVDSEGNSLAAIGAVVSVVGKEFLKKAIKEVAKAAAKVVASATIAAISAATVKAVANSKSKSKKKTKQHTVYVLQDTKGKVEYVGRTTNVAARESQHKNNPYKRDLEMIKVVEDVSYDIARGTEQRLIEFYGTLNRGNYRNNQINGISPLNPKLDRYLRSSIDYLGEEIFVGGREW